MAMGTKRSPISLYLQRGTAARGFSSARAVRHQQRDRSGHVAESTQRDQSAAGDLPALRPDRDINPQVGEDAQPERLTGNLRARDGVDVSDGKRELDVVLAGRQAEASTRSVSKHSHRSPESRPELRRKSVPSSLGGPVLAASAPPGPLLAIDVGWPRSHRKEEPDRDAGLPTHPVARRCQGSSEAQRRRWQSADE